MQEEDGQQLNVNSPGCMKKGIVMHESKYNVSFHVVFYNFISILFILYKFLRMKII